MLTGIADGGRDRDDAQRRFRDKTDVEVLAGDGARVRCMHLACLVSDPEIDTLTQRGGQGGETVQIPGSDEEVVCTAELIDGESTYTQRAAEGEPERLGDIPVEHGASLRVEEKQVRLDLLGAFADLMRKGKLALKLGRGGIAWCIEKIPDRRGSTDTETRDKGPVLVVVDEAHSRRLRIAIVVREAV